MEKITKAFIALLTVVGILFAFPQNLQAASASFKTSASSSRVVIGKTFTVTVKVSSASVLGSWEYTINYNSAVISLVSGPKSVADAGNGSLKSKTYTYTFKAIKSGSSNITVKSYAAYDWNERQMSSTASGTSVRVITQAELEASYSKNNNLKSLSVSGATLSPAFKSDVSSYSVSLEPNTTSITINAAPSDTKASVAGTGTFSVIEGENKFEIKVTAENGSQKTYTLLVNVIDPNPIQVKSSTGEELTVVKRSSALTIPATYSPSTIEIQGQSVPALLSEITNLVLVGLKNKDGEIELYKYENEKFIKYVELKLNDLVLLPLDVQEDFDYLKTKIIIDGDEIEAFKYKEDSNFALILAVDTETGEKNYYTYDITNNTVVLFDDEEILDLKEKNKIYLYIIIGLAAESLVFVIVLIALLKKKSKNIKDQKDKIKKLKEKNKSPKKSN